MAARQMQNHSRSMGVHDPHSPRRPPRLLPRPVSPVPDEVPVSLDLARAELYRLLDELARSTQAAHDGLVRDFERAWEAYKEQTAKRSRLS
jgi:hypothetical protein